MKKYLVFASLVVSVIVLFAVIAHSQPTNKTPESQPVKTPESQPVKTPESQPAVSKVKSVAAKPAVVNPPMVRPVKTGVMTPQKIQKSLTIPVGGQYLLFLPKTYGKTNKLFPLILFLHGSGECGTDLNLVKKHGVPRVAPLRKNFPFIVLAPQCPKGAWWTDTGMIIRVMAMLDEVCNKYNVDRSRIYLTGLSMGGFGTWALLEQFPNRFAAAAPVCGSGGNPYLAGRMRNVPIRIYHGEADKNVSIQNSVMMNGALKQAKANVKLITYPKMGHNIWNKVYISDDFYDWLLKQKK